jgi:tRNA-Thr(GGU) m(6)t(6)A37 methyltransferase TsaA
MENRLQFDIIARIHSPFGTKFGIPRQSALIEEVKAQIVFEPAYRNPDAVRGLEQFSHLWLLWHFSEAVRENWSPTVRPPRLGGNVRMGVFATRSPFRPNPIGLSCVKLDRVELHPALGPMLHVSGADLMDGTPILDVKPYLSQVDAHPEAAAGFTAPLSDADLQVNCPPELLEQVPEESRLALLSVLAADPRPRYQSDCLRVYGMRFAGCEVKFTVEQDTVNVKEIVNMERKQGI